MPERADRPQEVQTVIELPHDLVPSPEWTSEKLLVFDAVNGGPYMADVVGHFADGEREMTIRLGLFPGLATRVVLPLSYLDSERVIPGRSPHRFKCVCSGGPVDPSRLTQAKLSGQTAGGRAAIRISEPQLTAAWPQEWPRAQAPLVDDLHQWAQREWPGKTPSLEAIRGRITEELLSSASGLSGELDRWGGWAAIQFRATGYFRTERDRDRWWLVDPDGHPFYSIGVDCVRPNSVAETSGNEDLFADLPPRDGPYGHLWGGPGEGEKTLFDAMRHNLVRALGERWFEQWTELCSRRLRSWGFNTVGNWSDIRFCRFAGLPYVWQLRDFPTTEKTIFRGFPDVFSDEYVRNSRRFAEQLADFREDRGLVGYFLRNEPHWAFGDYNLVERMLVQGGPSACRERFVEWLKELYGRIGALNRAWGSDFPGFDVLAVRPLPEDELASDAARADLKAFNRMMIDRYVRIPSEECKKVDPNHLNLGVRYAWIAHDDLLAGADAFDVFSINGYRDQPQADVIARCAEAAGAPVLIGEFHTGALDRGLPDGGLRVVHTQQDRADCYRYYVEQGAAIPELVGAHYFQWNDQHAVGRHDGENWQIGVVDICQQPYEEFVSGARRSHARIYRVALGELRPFDRLPAEIRVT